MTGVFRDDVPIVLERDGLEVRSGPLGGGMSVVFVHVRAGTALAPALRRSAGGPPPSHWVYVLRGQLAVGGAEPPGLYEAGQALHLSASEEAMVLEECELVAFAHS